MHIRKDEINRIALDRYTTTSGRYEMILASSAERGENVYDFIALDPATYRVIKIVRLSVGSAGLAVAKWEHYKQLFTGAGSQEEENDQLIELPSPQRVWASLKPVAININTGEMKIGAIGSSFDLPGKEWEWLNMPLKMRPRGARIFASDIQPVDQITARAQEAGIIAVVEERNKPKPTMGIVISVGEDPLAQELYKPGDIIMFGKHAGNMFMEAGRQYRSLELHEIIGVRDPEDGIGDITGTPEMEGAP